MKAYIFEAQAMNKVYGDISPTQKKVLVLNAKDKAQAKEIALQNTKGLRLVNAGRAYKDANAAKEAIEADNKLTASLISKGYTQYFAAPVTTVDVQMQRDIGKLLGL